MIHSKEEGRKEYICKLNEGFGDKIDKNLHHIDNIPTKLITRE